jgi:hypothetical protein
MITQLEIDWGVVSLVNATHAELIWSQFHPDPQAH